MDSSNANATPTPHTNFTVPDVGWDYTPLFSYNLTGVDTRFGQGFAISTANVTEVVFQGGPPSQGGTLLRSASFTAVTNVFVGGVFAPLTLQAGQTYFIGFEGVNNLGVNLTTNAGATALGTFYYDSGDKTFSFTPTSGDVTGTKQVIMVFNGFAIPEPKSVSLVGWSLPVLIFLYRVQKLPRHRSRQPTR
jgi:hypothetical protein